MILRLSVLALFGIAMAHLEGVVVVYLRKALGINDVESNKVSVNRFPRKWLNIEMGCCSFPGRDNLGRTSGFFPLDLCLLGPLLLFFTLSADKMASFIQDY